MTKHEQIALQLKESIKDDRVPHARMFVGKIDFGSYELALQHAYDLIASGSKSPDEARKKAQEFNHPDLHFSYPIVLSKEIRSSKDLAGKWMELNEKGPYFSLNEWTEFISGDANKNALIGKDEALSLNKKLNLSAFAGEKKVQVIWKADMMNAVLANKLLKLIEEPPADTHFILVAESIDSILPTIVSRTQIINVPPYQNTDIEQYLAGKGVDQSRSAQIAAYAQGNMRTAINLAENLDQESELFGQFSNWMRVCYRKKVSEAIEIAGSLADLKREKIKTLLAYATFMFRECMLSSYVENYEPKLSPNEGKFVQNFAPFINGANITMLSDEFNKAIAHIERYGNPKIILLDLSFKVFRLLHLKQEPSNSED